MIDWEDNKSHVLCNPRMPQELQYQARNFLRGLKSHIWVATSSRSKWVALSKEAFLVSARSVNEHLESTHDDIWLHCLPDFHVGGLGIRARAYLSGAPIIHLDHWDAEKFQSIAADATLTALVPTQIYDLVSKNLKAPPSLRAVVVGGGALSDSLYQKACQLGWPLMPSYGLTECASQAATAKKNSTDLQILPHMELKISPQGHICLKSASLLTTYAYLSTEVIFEDPKIDGWFETEDLGELRNSSLVIRGRSTEIVKILGENVNLADLTSLLEQLKENLKYSGDLCLIAHPDPREGVALHLFVTAKADELLKEYHQKVMPYERIRNVHLIDRIPRTELGKPLKEILKNEL